MWHLIPQTGVPKAGRYLGDIEDERRLFYVAMTRSQKFLFATWAPVAGNRRFTRASEFYEAILASRWVKRPRVNYEETANRTASKGFRQQRGLDLQRPEVLL